MHERDAPLEERGPRSGRRRDSREDGLALYDRAFERRHGLETLAIEKLDGLTIRVGERTQGFYYEGMRMLPLRRLFAKLRKLVPPDAALVDLGCGKGNVLLAAAEAGVANIRGVEFARELCEQARSTGLHSKREPAYPPWLT
jgi:2-polyprenyl-3-methyl-5-hydroxy-6-metoxy-1,4-benzoquinol methylase